MGRLIDADKIKTALEEAISKNISSVIDAHPTAYDPDKVVKQLEELTDEMEQFNCTGMLSDIIEVVKAGGVNG